MLSPQGTVDDDLSVPDGVSVRDVRQGTNAVFFFCLSDFGN